MDDRALLEAAARAAGITLPHFVPYGVDDWQHEWNPLTDDGDALRLASVLRMTVRHDDVDACIAGWHVNQAAPTTDGMGPWFWKEWNYDDAAAATRRAITRAAAAMAAKQEAPQAP